MNDVDTDWGWYAGRGADPENYDLGPENTREAIVQVGLDELDGEPFTIAALSPRSADGLGSLAAKDGAAAPPQAPVAGSEDAASEVAG